MGSIRRASEAPSASASVHAARSLRESQAQYEVSGSHRQLCPVATPCIRLCHSMLWAPLPACFRLGAAAWCMHAWCAPRQARRTRHQRPLRHAAGRDAAMRRHHLAPLQLRGVGGCGGAWQVSSVLASAVRVTHSGHDRQQAAFFGPKTKISVALFLLDWRLDRGCDAHLMSAKQLLPAASEAARH